MRHLARKRRDEEFRARVAEFYGPDIIFWDDHDNAIIGFVTRCGQEPFALYDTGQAVKNYVKDGMTEEEAQEWIDFNWNAWIGPTTPGSLEVLD